MTFKNIDIYLSRMVSALCLFLILGEANIWLSPMDNTILVLGYRLFILFTPFLFLFFKHRLTFIAFLLIEMGLGLWLAQMITVGTILFAMGISISGYMLKYYSSFSTRGAAGNKIALNVGSVLSGAILVFSQNMMALTIFCSLMMIVSLSAFIRYYHRENITAFTSNAAHFKLNGLFTKNGIAWAIVGFVTGVKLIAIVSILPQYLIASHHGQLPAWYGSMLILNSLLVVALQIPVMNKIKHLDKITATLPLLLGMLIILFSTALGITTPLGAFIWTFSLSIVECTISYLDKLSQDDGLLLIKEASVGLGSAMTVCCVRFLDPKAGAILIGIISSFLLLGSLFIFYRQLKPSILTHQSQPL